MSPGLQLVRLRNGDFGIRSDRFGEVCHPVAGPEAEARALYVDGTDFSTLFRESAVLWDVGLGGGANILTVLRALSILRRAVHIVSFDFDLETLQFGWDHRAELGYFRGFEEIIPRRLASPGTIEFEWGGAAVSWTFVAGDFPKLLQQAGPTAWPAPGLILFDPFSPARNPDMWSLPVFRGIFKFLLPERPAFLPTYSRSTSVRVGLLLAGFFVGSGPALPGKEETTVASNQPGLIRQPLDRAWLQRVRASHQSEPMQGPGHVPGPISESSWQKLQEHPQFANRGA